MRYIFITLFTIAIFLGSASIYLNAQEQPQTQEQTEGKATSSPVAIKKVPILVEGKVDKDVITIGDRINYALTIRHEKNVRVVWENNENLTLSPFNILKKDIEKT